VVDAGSLAGIWPTAPLRRPPNGAAQPPLHTDNHWQAVTAPTTHLPSDLCATSTLSLLRRFDLAGEFSVFAAVEYQSGQVKCLARGELIGQRHDDVRRSLDADDGGRAGPADDLQDPNAPAIRRRFGAPLRTTLGAVEIIR